MSIFFRSTPVTEPLAFDSLGNGWEQDRVLRPKGYPFYHYLQTEYGEGRITAEGKIYTLHENEGILFAPSVQHSYEKTKEKWLTIFATFTGTIESSIPQMLGNRRVIFVEKDQGLRIASLVQESLKKYDVRPIDEKGLSIDCYSLLMNFVDGIQSRRLAEDPLYQRYVAPVIKEIEIHYYQELTVEELSRLVYITPQYLSRLFRRFLNCSPYEYLTSFRISKAKELLIMKLRLEVREIAARTGFSDPSHFIAVFKKHTGFTPLEFRRLN